MPMPVILVFLIFLPLMEIGVFIIVGDEIGVGATLLLTALSAVGGWLVVQYQGMQALRNLREVLQRGQLPLDAMFDGICIAAAGALLIFPGFVSDALGFGLLLPPLRALLRRTIHRHSDISVETSDSTTLEGEYQRLDDER